MRCTRPGSAGVHLTAERRRALTLGLGENPRPAVYPRNRAPVLESGSLMSEVPSMQPSASLFKAYDLRGIVPTTLTEDVAEALGRAFAEQALAEGERSIAVGRDGRLSGPALSTALVRGLIAGGAEVIDVGRVTTPMLWFAASTLCRTGIQVTASHNPKDHNGFKLMLAGRSLHGEELQALRRAIEAGPVTAPEPGGVRHLDVFATYLARITSH